MTAPNIRFKRSAVAGKRPTKSQLPLGELALNTYDGQLFTQVDTGGVGIGTTVISLTPWKEIFGTGAVFYENNVGIGSNNPAEKLSVEGDARVSNDLTVEGGTKASGDLYTDTIRRYTDNSTSTKIALESDKMRFFVTNGVTPKLSIQNGVTVNSSLNVVGFSTLGSTEISGNLEVDGSAEIDGQFQVDGFADFHEDVRILGKLEILNEVEVDTIIGDGSGLSGIVTGLTAGNGISITNTGGIYEIASTLSLIHI